MAKAASELQLEQPSPLLTQGGSAQSSGPKLAVVPLSEVEICSRHSSSNVSIFRFTF